MSDEIVRLDAATGAAMGVLDVDRRRHEMDEPHAVAVSPDGRHLYATLAHGEPTLWKYELPADRLVGRLTLPAAGAARIGITPDGEYAFVPDYDRAGTGRVGEVAVVRLHDLALLDQVPACLAPHDAAPHPTRPLVAVVCTGSDEVVLLDTRTREEFARWHLARPGEAVRPMNAAWAPDGHTLYVALHHPAAVLALDSLGRETGRAALNGAGAQLAIGADGRYIAAVDRVAGQLHILATDPLRTQRVVELPVRYPHGVTMDADGGRAFVTMENDFGAPGAVAAVAVPDGEILWTAEAGLYPLGVAYVEP